MRRLLGLACLAIVVVRLAYAWQPLRSDEGGYLFLARRWDPRGGDFLYGDYHVDRPFLLMEIYRVAARWEWDGAIRVLAIPFVLVAVLALTRAGFLLAGWSGARWAVAVAAALVNSPALAADQADGELFAVTFVAASLALTLQAWQTSSCTAQRLLALAAGACAASAFMVKQSFLDGLVFATVLLGAQAMRERRVTAPCRRIATGLGAGVVLLGAVAWGWAAFQGLSLHMFWADVVGFRGDALGVLWSGHSDAPRARAATLVLLALVSMTLPMAWTWLRWSAGRAHSATTPVVRAITATLLFEIVAMVSGGSYWPHYLLQMVPAVVLCVVVLVARSDVSGSAMPLLARAAVASAAFCAVAVTVVYATVPYVWWQQRTGQWLKASAAGRDTVFVSYGNPSVLEAADLPTPYPYLWSLPMRTLDPQQDRLRRLMGSDEAPTWIVKVNSLGSWGIDRDGGLRALIEARYDEVAEVCGHSVLLRADVVRQIAPMPRC